MTQCVYVTLLFCLLISASVIAVNWHDAGHLRHTSLLLAHPSLLTPFKRIETHKSRSTPLTPTMHAASHTRGLLSKQFNALNKEIAALRKAGVGD
jgi:hypothetical protein